MNAFLCRCARFLLFLMASAATVAAQTPGDAYGTTNVTYYRVGATDFRAYSTADAYFDDGRNLWTIGAGESTGWFNATPHLPSGALLTELRLEYCDINSTDQHLWLIFQYCDPIL